MMTKGFVKGLLFLLIIAAAMSGCTRKENTVVNIGSMPTLSATIYAVGVEKGFFNEAGIDVKLTVFRSAVERDAAATSGNLDGFMTDMMGAAALHDKEFGFIMTSSEFEDFGVMAGAGYDASDKGTVGISNNTIIEYVMDTYMKEGYEKVNILAVPDRLAALLNGEVDLGIFPQPFIGIIMGAGGEQLISTAKEGLQPVVVVFNENLISEEPEVVEAFYEGYENALQYMRENDFDMYKDVMVTYGLATEDTVDRMRLPLDKFALTAPSEDDFDAIIAWMLEKGVLENPIKFEEINDSRFVTN